MTRRTILFVGVVGGALLLAACGGSSPDSTPDSTVTTPPPGEVSDVSIENFLFGPSDLTVSVGETIRWTNKESGIPHDTTADEGLWESETLRPGDQFEFTFTEPGTYTYFCSIHPNMRATITVTG
jgi:plastocyanin